MISLDTIDSLIKLIVMTLAYGISVTLGGYFRAWTATKMGDDTAERLGFLTLNPFAHFDLFGYALLCLISIGRGGYVPVDWSAFTGRFRIAKCVLVFLSDTLVYLLLSASALTFMIALFGERGIMLSNALYATAEPSSFALVLIKLVSAMIYLNITLAIISLGGNIMGLFLRTARTKAQDYAPWVIIAPIILLVLFVPCVLSGCFTVIVAHVGSFLAKLLGV